MNKKDHEKSNIKCIPTWYNGILFRSRTEARTALLIDALGRKYEYEKEGYSSNGTNYLPDFDLGKEVRVEAKPGEFFYTVDEAFWEVKGKEEISDYEEEKLTSFINTDHVLYISGQLPKGNNLEEIFENIDKKFEENDWLFSLSIPDVSAAMYPGRSKSGEFTFYQDPDSPDMDRLWTYKAYSLALNAQFEHGKKPRIKLTDNGPVNLEDLAEFESPLESAEDTSMTEILDRLRIKKESKSIQKNLKITPSLNKVFKEISEKEGISVNSLINAAMEEFVEHFEEVETEEGEEMENESQEKELHPLAKMAALAKEFLDNYTYVASESSDEDAEIEIESKSLNVYDCGLMDKKDNRSHRISIFVTEYKYEKLQELKKSTGVSVNEMINLGIDKILKDNEEFL